jgi:hypothetical protein
VVDDVVQASKAKNLAMGEGATDDDNFTGEVHVILRDDIFGSDVKVGGSGHHRATVTQDAFPYLAHHLSRV